MSRRPINPKKSFNPLFGEEIMRHLSAGRKLGRTTSHRWALFRNLMQALVDNERIETTLHKAKELRSFADHLITLGKQDTLWARRQAFDFLRCKGKVGKLFSELAPRFKDRNGGYTRVLKLGYRLGDSAAMALIEYLPSEAKQAEGDKPKTEKKKAPARKKEAAPKAAAKPKAKKEAKESKEEKTKTKKAPKKKVA